MAPKKELHLIIIWEKGRDNQAELLSDINSSFCVKQIFEICWSKKNISDNFSRFYGAKLPKGSSKEKECGTGPFLLVIFEDLYPVYETRQTTSGAAIVNKNIFDKKKVYREKTNGCFRIHSTNDIEETRHDLMLLLGYSVEQFYDAFSNPWDGSTKHLTQDIVASTGWDSIEQLFTVLNETVNYVVIRNYECLPSEYTMQGHGDIDLLVQDIDDIVFLTNAKKVVDKDYRVHYSIAIDGDEVLFDFRHVGDNYYDIEFEKKILERRVLNESGIYIPCYEDYFYSLLYHALIHKPSIGSDYIDRLDKISSHVGINDFKLQFNTNWKKYLLPLLSDYLSSNHYSYTVAIDKSVYFNEDNTHPSVNIIGRPKWVETLKRRDFISVRLRVNLLVLHLLTGIIPKNIFRLKLRLGGFLRLDICLGKLKDV